MRKKTFGTYELVWVALFLGIFCGASFCRADDLKSGAGDKYRQELEELQGRMRDLRGKQDYRNALAVAKKIVGKLEDQYGELNSALVSPMVDLGNLYRLVGKQKKAEEIMQRSLEISEKTLEWNDPHMLDSLRGLAGVRFDNRKYPEAQPLLLRSLAIERRSFGEASREAKTTKWYLGRVFAAQGKFAEAEAVLGKKAFKQLRMEMNPQGAAARNVNKSKAGWIVGIVIGAVFLILVVMGVSMSRSMRLEVIFFNDILDVFLSIMPLVVLLALLLIGLISRNKEYIVIAWRIILPLGMCYSVGYNMIVPWLFNRKVVSASAFTLICVGLSRLMITSIFPVGGLIIYVLLQPSRDGDNEIVYEMRKAMLQLKLMLFFSALAGVIRVLINGDAVRELAEESVREERKANDRAREANSSSRSGRERSAPLNPYDVLGVSPGDSKDAVLKAYRQLALKYHPDRVANLGEELRALANRKMQEINWAYSVLIKGGGHYSYS